jgi:hypothetical protein
MAKQIKLLFLNLGVLPGIIFLSLLSSCFVNPAFEANDCPETILADLIEVSNVFFSPYKQMQYSGSEDTVSVYDFRYNLEFHFIPIESENLRTEIAAQILNNCHTKFFAQNISNIQIFLTGTFDGMPPGTDISYLFSLQDDTPLNRFRDFANLDQFLSLKFKAQPTEAERLSSNLIVYLRNGEKLSFESISPMLIP